MEIDDLREQRKSLWKKVRESHATLMRGRKLVAALEKRYSSDEAEYEACDRKLAMLDGRFSRVLMQTRKAPKTLELTNA